MGFRCLARGDHARRDTRSRRPEPVEAGGRMSRPAMVETALRLHDRGLAVLPAVDDDGKSVAGVMRGFHMWRRRLPREKVEQLFTRHPDGCVALLVWHCGLVVVDCDDDAALAAAEARFGRTPVLVRTPS